MQASHLALVSATAAAIEHEPSARTPQQAFCARLKAARERRGIALKAVAASTKVTTSLFEALERGDISRWPKGIYKRAFFRGYAAAIGLPPESTAEEFLRLFPDEKPPAPADAPDAQRASTHDAAAFRLTLAPDPRRWRMLEHLSRRAAIDATAMLILALALAWWASLDAWTTAAMMAIGYYPQLARQARALPAMSRARSRGRRPAEEATPAAPGTAVGS